MPANKSSADESPLSQQLDELDALMQRMLALPVESSARAEDPGPIAAQVSFVAANPLPARDHALRPSGSPTQPQDADPAGSPEFVALPALLPTPISHCENEPHSRQALDPETETILEKTPVLRSFQNLAPVRTEVIVVWWLRPLWAIDSGFENCTSWLGPIGRGLRSNWGKRLLGWIGLACFVSGIVWLVWQGLGWTW